MGILKKWLNNDEDVFGGNISGDEYYDLKPEEALQENDGNNKMIKAERHHSRFFCQLCEEYH